MKKFLKTMFVSALIIFQLFPLFSFASEVKEEQLQDVIMSEEEFNRILEMNTSEDTEVKATGLITDKRIAITRENNTLKIAGRINCTTDVIKCGFKEVVVQRCPNGTSAWSDVVTETDIYADSNEHSLSKQIAANPNFQYRVKCTFYAKKNIFSTQTITSYSNEV